MENGEIVWMDMEMTGLNVDKDQILEIGCLVTDSNLKTISPVFHAIIHHEDKILSEMNEWCKIHHNETKLVEEVRNSKLSLSNVEDSLLEFLKKHVKEKTAPLAGNSIWMDRYFLRKNMSKVDEYLNYRIIDVSSIKELHKRWNSNAKLPEKKLAHRTISDIYESIAELEYYKQTFFKV